MLHSYLVWIFEHSLLQVSSCCVSSKEKLGCSVGQFLSILAAAESTGLIVAIISPLFDSLGSWLASSILFCQNNKLSNLVRCTRRMFLFGEFLTLAGLLLAAAYRSYWPVFIGFCLFEMGYGIIAPAFQTSVSHLVLFI